MEEMVQVLLERKDGHCSVNMICWLPVDPRVKVGKRVTLDKDKTLWTVREMYARALKQDIKQQWKVGGLV